MAKRSKEYLYGFNACFEAVRAGRRRVLGAFCNESSRNHPRLKKIARFLERNEISIDWVGKDRLTDLASSRDHQGVVLRVSPYPYVDSDDLFGASKLMLLDNVEDPHNVGAILRCAEVFGYHDILLPHRGVPDIYPSVVKVSAGACEYLRIARDASANAYFKRAMDQGYTVIALDAGGKASLHEIPASDLARHLLIIGGEDKSVGQFILNEAHHVAAITQHGRVNSLNASVAAGIAMHDLTNLPRD